MGGISTWEDVVEMMMAGASVVQIGAALFSNPMAPIEIAEGLENYVYENKISSISDMIGTVKPW